MKLSFQEKHILKNGSVIFYHEATLDSGEKFHLLTLVKGERLPAYFDFVARAENFPVIEIEKYATILSCDKGSLSEDKINSLIEDAAQ